MSVTFENELLKWGPAGSQREKPTLAEAQRYCRLLATTHYENFPVVSWLLPRKLHQHFYHIYAYCRWADDLGDEVHDTDRSLELLDWWRGQLRNCYAGKAIHPVFVALEGTIREFGIPPKPFEDLISAFQQDQRSGEYQTYESLLDYCRRSANPVGRLVLYVCRQYHDRHVRWSDSICTGLQLANFWQDVARDLEIGRIYLPKDDCRRFGYSHEDLCSRVTNEPFLKLMEFQVHRARKLLQDGLPLAAELPGRLQVDIELFARGGLKILDRIERIGYRVWETRPVVTKTDVAWLLCAAVFRALRRQLARIGRKDQNHR